LKNPEHDSRIRLLDSELAVVEPKTRAGLMVAAAQSLVGRPYMHEGRGPVVFDGFGFIRACVQVALDHQTGAFVPVDAIEDARGRNMPDRFRPQIQDDEVNAHALGDLLVAWGLEQVQYGPGARYTQPGDVKVSLGAGPAGAIVVTGFQPGQTEWVVAAWRPSGPEVRGDCMLGRSCARIYRWPRGGVAA
jgi:hypothetical protein